MRSGWSFACARQMQICANLCKFAQTVQNLFPNPFQPAGDPLALWSAGVVARQLQTAAGMLNPRA
jgi:hypothetical protein